MKPGDWKQLEEEIAARIREKDPTARTTRGSGNGADVLDVENRYLFVSCKDAPKKASFTIDYNGRDGWLHDQLRIPLGNTKPLVRFVRNSQGVTVAVIEMEEFFDKFFYPLVDNDLI